MSAPPGEQPWTMRATTPGEDARSNSSAVAGATWQMLIKLLTEARKGRQNSSAKRDTFFQSEDGYLQLVQKIYAICLLLLLSNDAQTCSWVESIVLINAHSQSSSRMPSCTYTYNRRESNQLVWTNHCRCRFLPVCVQHILQSSVLAFQQRRPSPCHPSPLPTHAPNLLLKTLTIIKNHILYYNHRQTATIDVYNTEHKEPAPARNET